MSKDQRRARRASRGHKDNVSRYRDYVGWFLPQLTLSQPNDGFTAVLREPRIRASVDARDGHRADQIGFIEPPDNYALYHEFLVDLYAVRLFGAPDPVSLCSRMSLLPYQLTCSLANLPAQTLLDRRRMHQISARASTAPNTKMTGISSDEEPEPGFRQRGRRPDLESEYESQSAVPLPLPLWQIYDPLVLAPTPTLLAPAPAPIPASVTPLPQPSLK